MEAITQNILLIVSDPNGKKTGHFGIVAKQLNQMFDNTSSWLWAVKIKKDELELGNLKIVFVEVLPETDFGIG